MKYSLQKYRGISTRHVCPACGKKQSFVHYVDENNQLIHNTVGRCNHESSCGYHYTPKQWFADHPLDRETVVPRVLSRSQGSHSVHTVPQNSHHIDYIPRSYVERSASQNSHFVDFLHTILSAPTVQRVAELYRLGATRERGVIFWQIDREQRIRTGKIIAYDPHTGRRDKEVGGINWVHAILKKQDKLPHTFALKQCLFGEHLLPLYPDKTVALVESEKCAILGSAIYPQYVWVATGGKSQLSPYRAREIKGRRVVLFPDADGYHDWVERTKGLNSPLVSVSDILERNATPLERELKIDIADWIIRDLLAPLPPDELEQLV